MIDEQLELAIAYSEQGEPDEALRIASNILNENPNEARALFVASGIFLEAERFGMAYNLLRRASQIVPKREQVWNNLGLCCMKLGLIAEARLHLNKSLQINKNNSAALNNLALIEVNECNPRKALELIDKSIKIDGLHPDVLETKGYAHLMLGEWADGWEGYEAMVGQTKQRTAEPRKPVPYWDGNKQDKLLIRGEQGLGDELAFASVLNSVTNNITLECDRRLEGLFKRSFPNIEVHGTRFDKSVNWDSDYQAWCLIGSLCWHYRTKDSDFDGKPYLKADPQRKLQWRALLDSLGDKPKIGIAWTGGLKDTFSERRSVDLETLLPILKLDAHFISLQYKTPDLAAFEAKHGIKIHHWPHGTQTNDYDDTAALVDELDLVVSVQTAVVHLCAGLGKECHVLVPKKASWRYSQDKYMWGDSVHLYRQTNEWPVKEIARVISD